MTPQEAHIEQIIYGLGKSGGSKSFNAADLDKKTRRAIKTMAGLGMAEVRYSKNGETLTVTVLRGSDSAVAR